MAAWRSARPPVRVMAFPSAFLDEVRARTGLAELIGRRVRLVKRGREHTGLCPFHNEKTPSFTVNEDKGFYHCFGCGAHGSAFDFVMQTEGLGFVEAVERLAGEAGLAMPARDPRAEERQKRDETLYPVLKGAAEWFEAQLAHAGGTTARQYLEARGVSAATVGAFRLGFAPERRTALKEALTARGFDEARLIEAGLLIKPEDGGPSFDRFRNRVMFPIADRKGRVIAFGGRALGEAKAKYLNSPETPVFHKGSVLYGLALAAPAVREIGTVVIVEGYMDVIALYGAGLRHVVAPLGTAVTEDQIRLLWRAAPEPILCLDGDAAGRKAAERAADRALPGLRPGCSLRFAFLPWGEDPDSVVRGDGIEALTEILDAAEPLAEVVWRSTVAGKAVDTPERRALLRRSLAELTRRIGDNTVRAYYREFFDGRLAEAMRGGGRRTSPRAMQRHGTKLQRRNALGSGVQGSGVMRERLLLATLLNHPEILGPVWEECRAFSPDDADLRSLLEAIRECHQGQGSLDSDGLRCQLNERGLADIADRTASAARRVVEPWARPEAGAAEAEAGWRHLLARHQGIEADAAGKDEAVAGLAENMDEASLDRLRALETERRSRDAIGDEIEPEAGVAR